MEWIDMGIVRGLVTSVTFATFLGICWWAYRPANRGRFEEDAMLAFEPDEQVGQRPQDSRGRIDD